MVLGKSRKNVEAYILIPPDCRRAIDLLIKSRRRVGIPDTNKFVFARSNAHTPLSGITDMKEVVRACKGLKYPERISSCS